MNASTCVLNDFQRLILHWNAISPFDAVDVMELPADVPIHSLACAAEEELQQSGLGPIQLSNDQTTCQFLQQRPTVEVHILPKVPACTVRCKLQEQMTKELNRPFCIDQDPLIRLWVLPSESSVHVGMTWQHWFLDGLCAGAIFHRLLARWLRLPLGPSSAFHFSHGNPNQHLKIKQTWPQIRRRWRSIVEEVCLRSRAIRLPLPQAPTPVQLRFLNLPTDALQRLRNVALPAKATVNDVLVAQLARAIRHAFPGKWDRNIWQNQISLMNIVNLRPVAAGKLDRILGLFLGFMLLDTTVQQCDHWPALLADIHEQSQRNKEYHLYLGSLNAMQTMRSVWPKLSPGWQLRLPELMRFTAAITNLRYPSDWYNEAWKGILRTCWRGTGMGVMVPITLYVTTVQDRLTLTLSYRQGAEPSVEAILQSMEKQIQVGEPNPS